MTTLELKQLHLDVFSGRSSYIPLLVDVKGPPAGHTDWDQVHDPAKMLESFLSRTENTLRVDSDWIPGIDCGFAQALPYSVFGASPEQTNWGEIAVKAIFSSIEEALEVEPVLCGGYYERTDYHLRYLIDQVPRGIEVRTDLHFSPLDIGVMLRGGDFYLDLMEKPEKAMLFMNRWLRVLIEHTRLSKGIIGEDMDCGLNARGLFMPGIRVVWDAIVNLQPDLIEKMMIPHAAEIRKNFGPVLIHYCTGNDTGGYVSPTSHVLRTIRHSRNFLAIDNHNGYQSACNGDAELLLQSDIGVVTRITPDDIRRLDELCREPFFATVPRENGRPLAFALTVDSVEEGRELISLWRQRFGY